MHNFLLYIPSLIGVLTGWTGKPIFPMPIEPNVTEYRIYADSIGEAKYQVLDYKDSALVVETVCAPICSSTARVYDKNSKLIRTITPECGGARPYAWIEGGQLHWQDNTFEMYDQQEKDLIAR